MSQTQPLVRAAETLGVDPFELLRLTVLSEQLPTKLEFDGDLLDTLRSFAGIEDWWQDGLPDDVDTEAALRAGISTLLDQGHVGTPSARIENLWTGLGGATRSGVQQAVASCIDRGILQTGFSARGALLSAAPEHEASLRSFAQGDTGLAELLAD